MLVYRTTQEEREKRYLSKLAALSSKTLGRQTPEPECEYRNPFQRDRDRIIHSKAFRRLKHKTQVFISPEGDHFRTRLTHVLEVSQISRTCARILGLNEDLVEAISLGHDLGHTPFGHIGEDVLNRLLPPFRHEEQSLRVVDILEKREGKGFGLNLTQETRDGILRHSINDKIKPITQEGLLVRYCDKISYICHDLDDAIRAGLLKYDDLPSFVKEIGKTHSERVDTLIRLIISGFDEEEGFKDDAKFIGVIKSLRDFMMQSVYSAEILRREEEKVTRMFNFIIEYLKSNIDKILNLPEVYGWYNSDSEKSNIAIKDYISGMTDSYIVLYFEKNFLPSSWPLKLDF
ncbi:deoxyguanosinetriphosphate triphosphohydrolase [Thermodesulfobium narugense DSM 14796]|uniref:Deoxyguanosinetriphosphate triphosphohydrolase n=1 Tax=Thermodesulfobium narugense DSM 14796 TaxID=747365 RepID=M1E727_9BACT|nr:deoxyguanosinetriphosphate triphosphohydrolase [Thermodesulfobium narugense]AEE15101.1 deoxyguanosinetriphosphate triphosphohydrolase [Thermodesulfobium narugense DSM 14796]